MSRLRCDDCGRTALEPEAAWRCGCGGPWSLVTSSLFSPESLDSRGYDMWRYREGLGFEPGTEPVTLGEGFTPLLDAEIEGFSCLFKMETLNPTGSFKDRGASAVMTRFRTRGVERAIEDSSGNAGVAMASYGARAGIPMEILVPGDAPRPKLAAIEACGARLVRVAGSRQDASAEALRRAGEGDVFASHVWNPWFNAGTRSFAFEIWEQTRPRAPERIFFPVGNGSLLVGAWEGFELLRQARLVERVPRLVAVQAALCSPLLGPAAGPGAGLTIADGLRVAAPPRARRILEAVRASGGEVLAVTEDGIRAARRALGRQGLDVEPTAAVGFAGALEWRRRRGGGAGSGGASVVALTGSGLKVAA